MPSFRTLQARAFAGALRAAGARTVSYAEIPNAHHAFDTIATLRCQLAAEAVAAFLGIVYGRHVAARASAPDGRSLRRLSSPSGRPRSSRTIIRLTGVARRLAWWGSQVARFERRYR